MQLDGMAAKVLDQEKAMQAMAEELECFSFFSAKAWCMAKVRCL
jgi:hypothetical protein